MKRKTEVARSAPPRGRTRTARTRSRSRTSRTAQSTPPGSRTFLHHREVGRVLCVVPGVHVSHPPHVEEEARRYEHGSEKATYFTPRCQSYSVAVDLRTLRRKHVATNTGAKRPIFALSRQSRFARRRSRTCSTPKESDVRVSQEPRTRRSEVRLGKTLPRYQKRLRKACRTTEKWLVQRSRTKT